MTKKDRTQQVALARAALTMAAMRCSLVTYGELGRAIGMGGVDLRNEMRHVLDDLSAQCNTNGEPVLAALVVNKETGAPGQGWVDGDRPWHGEVARVFRHWS